MDSLTGDACRSLEAIIREDLEHATVASASIRVDSDGRIIIEEITFRLPDDRLVSPAPIGGAIGTAADMRLEVYDDRHGWREATIAEDYAEELADLTRVWHPEPDTVEEARL
jgi:hypothetical protein